MDYWRSCSGRKNGFDLFLLLVPDRILDFFSTCVFDRIILAVHTTELQICSSLRLISFLGMLPMFLFCFSFLL